MVGNPDELGILRAQLGDPAHSGDDFLVYQGDCVELMESIEPALFQLTVTSPPYNIGKEYEVVKGVGDYLDWCECWIKHIYRLTKWNGAFWLNLGYFPIPDKARAIPIPYLLWDRVPFYLIQEVVWHYGAGVAAKLSFSPRNEKFLWYVPRPRRLCFQSE